MSVWASLLEGKPHATQVLESKKRTCNLANRGRRSALSKKRRLEGKKGDGGKEPGRQWGLRRHTVGRVLAGRHLWLDGRAQAAKWTTDITPLHQTPTGRGMFIQ